MGRRRLDERLLRKVALKLGKQDLAAVNVLVSKKAAKLGISSEAALIVLARECDIGTALYQRKLDPAKQTEVRDALPAVFASRPTPVAPAGKRKRSPPRKPPTKIGVLRAAIDYLINDPELRDRCQDTLVGSKNFDIAINQATLVLEDRIRKKAKPAPKLVGEALVNFAFKEDLSKSVLRVHSKDGDDQRGLTQILRGVVSAFRNPTHHHISPFSREDALKVCAFIDVLLHAVDSAVANEPQAQGMNRSQRQSPETEGHYGR
jgi:uncharacterized protein (TIGR02391 family)